MLGPVAHVGITVRDMDKVLAFYQDILGFAIAMDVTIAGEEAERLTRVKGTVLRSVYLRSGAGVKGPPLELLQFIAPAMEATAPHAHLRHPGISEIAFWVQDIDKTYTDLGAKGVEFYSAPQLFALEGYGKAKAVYFWDPEGTTLELMQMVKEA